MNIINLTPHEINIYDDERNLLVVVPPSGTEARIQTEKVLDQVVNLDDLDIAIPLYKTTVGGVVGLPAAQPHVIYVVSGIFRFYCNRPDLYQPGELIRNETGQPVGCVGLGR